MHRLIKTTRKLTAFLFATVLVSVPGLVVGSLPANTCIVSGSLDRTPTGSSEVAMTGELDSYWRDFGVAVADKFSPHECRGIMIIVR